jgi:murein DD-endopeptidase MepM/ murein hydrolase activator NlpD
MPSCRVFHRFLTRKNFKPFIALGLCLLTMAAFSLWFSTGLLFAGGGRDIAPMEPAAEAGDEQALPGEIPEPAAPGPAASAAEPPAPNLSRMAAIPDTLRPGEPVTVGLAVPLEDGAAVQGGSPPLIHAALIDEQGRRLSRAVFFPLPGAADNRPPYTVFAAILAVPSTLRPGKAVVRAEPAIAGLAEIPLVIMDRDFVSETIALDEANTDLRTLPDAQKTLEAERLWVILNRQGETIYSGDIFGAPVTSTRRTSFFGDRRVYRYVDGSADTAIHAGIDYGVPRGTPVSAPVAGKVVLARPRIVTGNSVVVEHLPGLYSLYYHLDTIAVSEGDVVGKGTILGESGSTGLATGPHLHWEIRAAGENADPDAFMRRPVLDKAEILGKLFD